VARTGVWVAGFPSIYGGADTELDHLIDLFRSAGVDVHLVPMFGAEKEMRADVVRRGCSIHDYTADVFADKVVISFCNGRFLDRLPEIVENGRPRRVIWFNCMTWLFEAEKVAHTNGWIDDFGFESKYQEAILGPQLTAIGPYRKLPYRPYFNSSRVRWIYRDWHGTYRVGRISRDDQAKYAADTWQIFDRVLVPSSLKKKVYVLGYGPNAAKKIGPAPKTLDWRTWRGAEIDATEFFKTVDTMIHKTGGSRESYCRVVIEALAHGVVPIVEHDYAFPELIVHEETGYLGTSSDEMSYFASMLAHNPKEHRRVAEQGRRQLEEMLVERDACLEGWLEVLGL
jgi:hypothetical protein